MGSQGTKNTGLVWILEGRKESPNKKEKKSRSGKKKGELCKNTYTSRIYTHTKRATDRLLNEKGKAKLLRSPGLALKEEGLKSIVGKQTCRVRKTPAMVQGQEVKGNLLR